MSEEKPVFKVTDRRLFNPDGSPREIENDERRSETTSIPPLVSNEPAASATPSSATTSTAEAAPRQATPQQTTPQQANAGATRTATESDPLFIELMMFVAENAAAMLSGHPQFGGEVNLPYAKQFIDMLGALRDKTIGNLSTEEQTTLDALLSQLRMQYVAQQNARPAGAGAPGGFTGSDITGGG